MGAVTGVAERESEVRAAEARARAKVGQSPCRGAGSSTVSVEGWSVLTGEVADAATIASSSKDAATALRKLGKMPNGPDVRNTPSGAKVVKVKVGPWMAFKMLFSGFIHPVEQLKAKHMLADYDSPAEDPAEELVEDEGSGARRPRHTNSNWWTGYSLLAHAQFHSPTHTRANEMIVSSWIRKAMEADNVRRVQIAQVLPLAVRMAFVPTEADVRAVQLPEAPAVRRRYKKRDTKYWSSWFGLRRSRYESG